MRAPVAVTMGCPVGVGPEIIVRLFDRLSGSSADLPVVVGDPDVIARSCRLLGSSVRPEIWHPGEPAAPGTLPVLPVSELDLSKLAWGRPTVESSRAMADYIRVAAQGCMDKHFRAMVTCPISKKALNEAGIHFPGHTEMLAELTGVSRFRMMMAGERLRVVLVTIHEPLAGVAAKLTVKEVHDCLAMTSESLQRDFGLAHPRIAVAGLNPHAGEQGMFGREEMEIIGPAVDRYRGAGTITGPWPPDTVFHRAASGAFDAVVAMYHDQGLIPFKLLHFKDGVNVTLGLPVVRTSVDHGTAYDIAGKGIADHASLAAALQTAKTIAANRAGTST
jgi:4-hydroxythreonine-4-phosphate dehydrogenase